jgi:hypothetical protein
MSSLIYADRAFDEAGDVADPVYVTFTDAGYEVELLSPRG